MNIAILGESPADEAAVAILAEAIVGEPISRANVPNLRAPGWTAIPRILPAVLKTLYFNSDVVGLVVVLDSNGSAMHKETGDVINPCDPDCRLCMLRTIADREIAKLTQRTERPQIRFAVGLAVPAIEAWLLSATQSGFNEIVWEDAKKRKPPKEAYSRKQLKVQLYGTGAPSLELEKQKMLEQMTLLVKDLKKFTASFPSGTAPLIRELQSWPK